MNRIEKLIAELCPNGVEWKKLGEVTIWDRRFIGVNKNMQKNVLSFKHISANDLKKLETTGGNIKLLSTGKFDGWTTEKLAEGYINEGEIISIPSGGSANIKYYNGKFVDSGNILAKSFDSKILNLKFCYYFLLTRIKLIESYFRGSGVKHPNMPSILNIPIPIPPLPIQEEIVKILDTFTELEAELELKLQAELEARKKQYEYYRNKLLTPVEHNGRWYLNGVEVEWKKLGEVCEINNGYTPSKSNPEYWENGTIPWFRMDDIRMNGFILDSSLQKINEKAIKGNKIFPPNSILVATSATIGVHALITVPHLSNQRFVSLSIKDDYKSKLKVKFLFYYFYLLDQWCIKNVTTSSFSSVDMNGFKKFPIPIPPLSEQERIVAILDKFDALVNDLTSGLPAEIEARRKQYEYYRDKLLNFNLYHCRIDPHRENCKDDSHRGNCKGDSHRENCKGDS